MSIIGLNSTSDAIKQIVTLSTGVIGLTVTFADKFGRTDGDATEIPPALYVAWVSFGVAVFFGVWGLLAIAGTLDRHKDGTEEPSAYQGNVRFPSFIMLAGFLIGVVATTVAGIRG